MKKHIFCWLSIAMALNACKKENKAEFTDSPVIEAYLEPGQPVSITLSRQIPFSADAQYSEPNLDAIAVQVIANGTAYTLQPQGNGVYTDTGLMVTTGTRYDLAFVYNKKKVSAYTSVPSKPVNYTQSVTELDITRMSAGSGPPSGGFSMPDPVKLTWDNPDGSYYLVVIENIESTLDPIRDFGDNAPPANRFRETPTNASGIEIRSMEFQYYGTHRLILYHVLPDYASLYDDNSTSSQNLTNPSTSITNGYGIFTGLNADTLWLEVKEP